MPIAGQASERVTMVDWLMVALAVASLAILVVEQAYSGELGRDTRRLLIGADLVIVGIFAIEFTYRISKADRKLAYAKSHWYDILGMVPVSHPMFRSFRLVRLLRIVVITSRFVRATNRTFGEATFEAVVGKYRDILVEEVADAIVLRSLDMLEPPLVRARFAARIGDTIDAHRGQIRSLVWNNIRETPGLSIAARLDATRRLVEAVEDVVLSTLVRSLRSDELNSVVSESLRGVIEEIRSEVGMKDAATRSIAEARAARASGGAA